MDDTSVTKSFVFTGDGKPSPDLSDFKPFGHIDEDKPKYSAIMIIEDEGVNPLKRKTLKTKGAAQSPRPGIKQTD